MAELTNRLEREAELEKIVRRMSAKFAPELREYLKTAKRLSDVPQEFWDRVKKDMQNNDEMAALILLIFNESAVQHYPVSRLAPTADTQESLMVVFKADSHRSGQKYVQNRLKQIIPGYIRRSKQMVGTAIRDLRDTSVNPTNRIKDAMDSVFGEGRAKTIGDTEGNLAMINGGRFGVKKSKIETIAIWAHSRIRPSHHANASVKPCPICSPREGTTEDKWGDYQPGNCHPSCDCVILELDRDGNVIGDDGTFSDTLERFGNRLPHGWLNSKLQESTLLEATDKEGRDGHWVTIDGNHVFIADGGNSGPEYREMSAKHHGKLASEHHSKLSDSGKAALQFYVGHLGYAQINSTLRGRTRAVGQRLTSADKKAAKAKASQLDAAMQQLPEMTVYRGVSGRTAHRLNHQFESGSLVGSRLHDPGFTSTSIDRGQADRFTGIGTANQPNVVMHVRLKNGQSGIAINHPENASQMLKNEREILLPRNMTLKIAKAHKVGGTLHILAIPTMQAH